MPHHLGSSTVITDHEGKVIQRLSYRPFGERVEAPCLSAAH